NSQFRECSSMPQTPWEEETACLRRDERNHSRRWSRSYQREMPSVNCEPAFQCAGRGWFVRRSKGLLRRLRSRVPTERRYASWTVRVEPEIYKRTLSAHVPRQTRDG